MEKINYIHLNPVRAGLVRNPEDYIYSSEIDYAYAGKGLVDVLVYLGLVLLYHALQAHIPLILETFEDQLRDSLSSVLNRGQVKNKALNSYQQSRY